MAAKKAVKLVKKFPTCIYVKRENEGTDDEYLNITLESAAQALDSTELTRVATYELVEVKEGRLQPVFN